MPAVILFGLISFYAIWTSNKRKAEISEHIQELTINVDNTAKQTLINSPFPLIIVETDGNIIWKSSKFVSEFENADIENSLNELIQEIKIDIQEKINDDDKNRIKDRSIQKELIIDNKNYKIIENSLNQNKIQNQINQNICYCYIL